MSLFEELTEVIDRLDVLQQKTFLTADEFREIEELKQLRSDIIEQLR